MGGTPTRTGDYTIERRLGEVERLHLQGEVLAAETGQMLDRIGVRPGWSCLDLGCGPRGITRELSRRVGPEGRVTGLDFDETFVEIARAEAAANTTFLAGDAYATGLPDAGFDLVHVRFLASTAGQPERLVAEALRLARPGGVVAFQEADFLTLNCYPPHPAWKALRDALAGCFPQTGEDPTAQRIFRLLRQGGLREVEYRPVLVGVRSGDPWQDYLPATIESLRGAVIARGLIAEAMFDRQLAECRRHLAEAGTVFTSYTIVQTWGRVAAPGT
ncbi:methyltransferase domain-containing protein [Amaricoccus sp.]|uniref:methyltransferase domain-containing protein n=1 Tax=Amaricoccus sp. TaxID=1872485 RepID=UPI002CCB55EB|nr:methyltransferase domain-containing protein [Amaricoccus sp.]HRW16924.1 methyltransferase domain-containing protein [Amaricoccus sp.]